MVMKTSQARVYMAGMKREDPLSAVLFNTVMDGAAGVVLMGKGVMINFTQIVAYGRYTTR